MTEIAPQELRSATGFLRRAVEVRFAPGYENTADQIEKKHPRSGGHRFRGQRNHQLSEGVSSMKSTTRTSRLESDSTLSFLVFVILGGVDRILGHTRSFESAVRMVRSDAERFDIDHGAVRLHVTDRNILAAYASGLEVEYRIDPSDRQIPEDEPSVDEVNAIQLPEDEPIDPVLVARASVATGELA